MPSLVSLAEELLIRAKKLDAIVEQTGTAYSSFDNDTFETLPEEAQQLRRELTDTSHTIQQLARGPRLSGLDIAFNWTDNLILRIILHYNLPQSIPLSSSATYPEISSRSSLPFPLVIRTIRAAIPLNIFDEPTPGKVVHTAISRLLVEDEGYRSLIALQLEDLGPAGTGLIDVWKRLGGRVDEGSEGESAFSVRHGGRPLFRVLAEEPEIANRFDRAMEFCVSDREFNSFDIGSAYDWKGMDREGARLVDLGGGYGRVCQTLARMTGEMEFVVRDLRHVVEEGRRRLPEEFEGRVRFEEGSFLETQKGDDPPTAFLISRCLHNWSDQNCVVILRALIPAMRQGSKVLIWDVVLEDTPVRNMSDRFNLQQDFIMATIANGKDRSLAQFKEIIAESDERFKVEGVRRSGGCKQSLIEVTWEAGRSDSIVTCHD